MDMAQAFHHAAVRGLSHRSDIDCIVGTHAGDMLGEITLDIGKTIQPHPSPGESIGMAAEEAHGSCTDLPPART
jgi:dihydrolipoamide dehydrogenase